MRLHGLIARIPCTHRYRVTDSGWRTTLFCSRTYNRVLRPGLALVIPDQAFSDTQLRRCFDQVEAAINDWTREHKVPA